MKVSYPHNKSQVNDVIQCMSLIHLFLNVHLHITLNIEKCEHFKFCLLLGVILHPESLKKMDI